MEVSYTPEIQEAPPVEATPANADESMALRQKLATSILDKEKEYQEEELLNSPDWAAASRVTWAIENGTPFEGTDEQAAQAGLELMSEINYNLGAGTVPFAAKMATGEFDDTQKIAVRYMMDTYDKKDISWDGFKRFAKEVAIDPTNLVVLPTLGAGMVGKGAAQIAARKGLMESIKLNVKEFATGAMGAAALEGAIYSAADDAAFQHIKMATGEQDEYSYGQTVGMATAGAIIAPTAVKGLKVAGEYVTKGGETMRSAINRWDDEVQALAGGGVPPVASPLDNLSESAKKNFPELDMTDFDAEDVEMLNDMAKTLDGMGGEDVVAKESTYKEGDVITAESDPSITPYSKGAK